MTTSADSQRRPRAEERLVDDREREAIRHDLDRTLVVEAAAGTGKTTELVQRVVAVLAEGHAAVDSIACVTFTEKAAGEMKLRLRAVLEKARHDAPAGEDRRANLERALTRLEEARINTIHGFCADLLRERSVEAGVDPRFEVLTEPEAERLYAEAFELWLQEKLEDPPEGVRRSLRRSARGGVDSHDGPVERLRRAGWTLLEWRDHPEPWRRDPFDRPAQIDELVDRLAAFADRTDLCTKKKKDKLYADTDRARRLVREIRTAEEVRGRDYDGVESALVDLALDRDFARTRKGYGKMYAEGLPREELLEEHRKVLTALRWFQRAADADLAARLQAELAETIARYEALKRRAGRLDFLDLLVRTRDLVRGDDGVRAEFQRRFTHLFVDEFQDTDPLQAEILLLLAADDATVTDWRAVTPFPGKLFLVADPKQSIYRFRRADVGLYLEIRNLLTERGADVLRLTTSFRGMPAIQEAVNAAFPDLLDGDSEAQQADYVPLSPFRSDVEGQPAVVALPVPRPYGRSQFAKYAVEASYPDAVGAFVEWLLNESGWTVTERDAPDARVPVAARHVCLLFRRFDSFFSGDVTRAYVEALEARGVRHLLVGGRSFHDREEVETLRTALAAIEWPDDELSVFGTLHGSLFAVGDEELLEYRHRYRRLHPFRLPDGDVPDRLQCVVDALRTLAGLHRGRNRRPIAETVNRLLERTRAHAGFVLRPSGEQALANVLHVAEQARAYEGSGGISFRGFVERLGEDAAGRKAREAPILEEGSEGVRLMTVHKAKGLEFPVVILVDPTATVAFENPGRAIDGERRSCLLRISGWSPAELNEAKDREVARDVAEGVRLCYVAATRARDLLVVPSIGDGPFLDLRREGAPAKGGWLSPLYAAIYPEADAWADAQEAPGAPRFGTDSVVDRPFDPGAGQSSVRPGLHRIAGRDVVWWDPGALKLGAEPSYGVRQAELMSKDAEAHTVERDAERHRRWEVAHRELVETAAVPTLQVRTATEWAAVDAGEADDVELVELPRERRRPSGPRFGSLVHAALATAPLDSSPERVLQVVELQARILGAPEKEVKAAAKVVERVFEHPLLERARKAAERGECRRETPVADQREEALIEGVVDLAFRENGTWTVVDFKTDQEASDGLTVYRRQVGLYAAVIARATGERAAAVLMRV